MPIFALSARCRCVCAIRCLIYLPGEMSATIPAKISIRCERRNSPETWSPASVDRMEKQLKSLSYSSLALWFTVAAMRRMPKSVFSLWRGQGERGADGQILCTADRVGCGNAYEIRGSGDYQWVSLSGVPGARERGYGLYYRMCTKESRGGVAGGQLPLFLRGRGIVLGAGFFAVVGRPFVSRTRRNRVGGVWRRGRKAGGG